MGTGSSDSDIRRSLMLVSLCRLLSLEVCSVLDVVRSLGLLDLAGISLSLVGGSERDGAGDGVDVLV